jgi:hypothetical protein
VEISFSLLIRLQLSDRPHRNISRCVSQDHKLMSVVSLQPVGVLRVNVRQDFFALGCLL